MKELVMDLSCELDEAEVNQRAQELSSTVVRRDEVSLEKGNVTKGYNERIAELEGNIRKLSKVIRARAEFRPVNCAVMFHSPVVGTKRIVRKDTGEIVRDEAMTSFECQNNLFEEPATVGEPAAEPVQVELPGTEPKCESCEEPATTIDNAETGVPLCQACKDELVAEEAEEDAKAAAKPKRFRGKKNTAEQAEKPNGFDS